MYSAAIHTVTDETLNSYNRIAFCDANLQTDSTGLLMTCPFRHDILFHISATFFHKSRYKLQATDHDSQPIWIQ